MSQNFSLIMGEAIFLYTNTSYIVEVAMFEESLYL